jgi:hypothetical protein
MAATTHHHQRHTFARIASEMGWARRLPAGWVDQLVHREAQFKLWGRAHPLVGMCTYNTRARLLIRLDMLRRRLGRGMLSTLDWPSHAQVRSSLCDWSYRPSGVVGVSRASASPVSAL